MLVTIRDQGLPAPAGGILISPWVDLTHSFPSIVSHNPGDYIPAFGFRHKPSSAWPPPNSDEILSMKQEIRKNSAPDTAEQAMPLDNSQAAGTAKKGYNVHPDGSTAGEHAYPGKQETQKEPEKDEPDNVSVVLDGQTVEIKDQIHMYTNNKLLSHPLVSPVLQPTLGGLPPLQILTGGGEMLRDEQIYLAHKVADPKAFPPADIFLDEYDPYGEALNKYAPTHVQLQVWDHLCHVAPCLSFTKPAKYMFRSVSQFGAWALARAQNTKVDILVDNDPPMSSTESEKHESSTDELDKRTLAKNSVGTVGKAGDSLPAFQRHMIRQRVDKRGYIYPMDPPQSFEALQMSSSQIGAFNPVLVKRWMAAKHEWDEKYAKEKLRVQRQHLKELYHEFQNSNDQSPPPCSLAARRAAPEVSPPRHDGKSYLMTMWSNWACKHDARTIGREQQIDKHGRHNRPSADQGSPPAEAPVDKGPETGPAEKSTEAIPVDEQASSSGPKGITIDADAANQTLAEEKGKQPTDDLSMGGESTYPGSPRTYKSSFDKPISPMLVLPDYDNKKSTEENASTKALFHAPGTIPTSASDTSLSRVTTKNRPASSRADSAAGFTDITEDASSTVADDKSLAVTNATNTTGVDNASTRAVLHAGGVVGVIGGGDGVGSGVGTENNSARPSIDALSTSYRAASDVDGVSSVGVGVENEERSSIAGNSNRPRMPERDAFRTADEF